jgi:endonuclease/exonuclease/phosphatase family metal-dependent hydrolase
MQVARFLACAGVALAVLASSPVRAEQIVVVTFNTGTTTGLPHDADPDDGYTSAEAAISDEFYGNGLAWTPAVEAVRAFVSELAPDIVAFQEIFYSGECVDVPAEARAGFVCEDWMPGDPTVAETVVGSGYQVACHLGKPDKCIAVRLAFGSLRGCEGSLCLDGLDGAPVPGCGGGSRIGRGVIDLASGGTLTVVSVHGTSGFLPGDFDCRVQQFEQVFQDLDGAPAANGTSNLILGDFNTDPTRLAATDPSAALLAQVAGGGGPLHFVSDVGVDTPPTYLDLVSIDHVISDVLEGSCSVPGLDGPPVLETVYFDHKPVVCAVPEPSRHALGLVMLAACVFLRSTCGGPARGA